MRYVWLLAGLLVLGGPACAQDADETTEARGSASPGGATKERARPTGRRLICQQQSEKKGMRGQVRSDDITVCLAEARLDCLKQAIAAGKRGPERKASIDECMAK